MNESKIDDLGFSKDSMVSGPPQISSEENESRTKKRIHIPRKSGKVIAKHKLPGAAGKDVDNGIRFESKFKKRLNRRKLEKAGRKAARGSKKGRK